jgi:hypothetical protein
MSEDEKPEGSRRMDTYCGLLLAVFAAILAITDLGAGRYGDDEKQALGLATERYSWYQSKSIKATLKQQNADFLESLDKSGTIQQDKKQAIEDHVKDLRSEVKRYKAEMKEILEGSAKIKKEEWCVAETEDQPLGQIIGAKEYKVIADNLGNAGDYYDGATLFLQLCLVLGAISLISPTDQSKRNFFIGMILMGTIGTVITSYAFYLVLA